ncbi:hypothetical protein BDV18DRAFT_142840 [Aspergillus unguis]
MSNIPAVSSGPSPLDTHTLDSRGSLERKRRHADDEGVSSTAERRDSVRSRPLSWHPSAPVEPPLGSTRHRSIGVSSILNHPATEELGVRAASLDSGREGLPNLQLPTGHSRFSSSSAVHLPSPSLHPANPPALSPGMRSHQNIAPASPSARLVGSTGYFPSKTGTGQSPLAQQLPGLQTITPSSPLPMDGGLGHFPPVSGHHHQASTHSTSTFASHRASTNQTPTPSSQEASPTTPISVFSQIGRSSPALSTAPPSQSGPVYMNSAPYPTVDPVTRLPIGLPGQRPFTGASPGIGGPQGVSDPPRPGMIPCFIDSKSGSSTQAEKRKANSDASRRFRRRKRTEMQMEQKITSQQDEIRKHEETIQKLVDELRASREQREFYRSERDYFREQASHYVQISGRPSSPQPPRAEAGTAPLERDPQMKVEETNEHKPGSLHPAVPGGSWSQPAYSAVQESHIAPDARQSRPMPPTPGAWSRNA